MCKTDAKPAASRDAVPPVEPAAKPPATGTKTIGLCMIVKNETKLIRRCLDRESLDASLKLLASDKSPPSMAQRIAANARFATDKMPFRHRQDAIE
jgi:hypothetical protein